MFNRLNAKVLLTLVLVLFVGNTVKAQTSSWNFSVTPYTLVPFNLQSDVTALGITESFALGMDDFFSMDQVFTGALRFEATKNDWRIFADISYTYAEDTQRVQNYPLPPVLALIINNQFNPPAPVQPGTLVNAGILAIGSTLTIDIGGSYRVAEGEWSNGNRYFIEPLVALRLSTIKSELDFELDLGNIPVVRTKADITDNPLKSVIGVIVGFETQGRWSAQLHSTIGSSLISQEDHFSVRVAPEATYTLSDTFALTFGYQFRHLNYERGQFGLTQTQHAASIGLRIGM